MPWYKLPHTEIVMWFQYEMDLEPAGTPPPPALPLATCGMLNVSEFGATGSGWHDDTTHIQAALDACASEGGTVVAPPGRFLVSAPIVVPSGVNFWGAGMDASLAGGTVILCSTADSGVAFGERGVGNTGGVSGNFGIDGNDVASVGMYVGLCIGRTFQNVEVRDSAGIGLLVEEAQNNTFIGIQTDGAATYGFDLNGGCGGNVFLRCGVNDYGAAGLHFRQSYATSGLVFECPTNNKFYGCISERSRAGATSGVHHAAGMSNMLNSCNLIHGIADTTVVSITYDGVHASNDLQLVSTAIWGDAEATPLVDGITMDGWTTCSLMGRCDLHNLRYAFVGDGTNHVDADDFTFGGNGALAPDLAVFSGSVTKRLPVRLELSDGQGGRSQLLSGPGTPEGACTAPVGSIYLRNDGGAGTSLYVKQSGTGNTGWVAK